MKATTGIGGAPWVTTDRTLASSFTNLWSNSDLSGEGNGTPLQYSCLENPMDGGAWWAAVYGVTESQTRLKRLSSSSSSDLSGIQRLPLESIQWGWIGFRSKENVRTE